MKTNVVMKIAVVFMAAFGAYAFSGSNAQQTPFTDVYYLNSENQCVNIEARCSRLVTGENCQIFVNGKIMPVFDLGCEINVSHNDILPVEWK
ncbi:MAG TPA: hypothetical protein VK050_01775 [Flavobacteriaceae bacterium]|nr:hypothetical protein [Flavobacteriaceae bacterium]